MKNKIEETTFKVRLFCRNCEKDWTKEIEKGNHIRYEKGNNYMTNVYDEKKKKKYFKCPNCGAWKKIARLPLL